VPERILEGDGIRPRDRPVLELSEQDDLGRERREARLELAAMRGGHRDDEVGVGEVVPAQPLRAMPAEIDPLLREQVDRLARGRLPLDAQQAGGIHGNCS
jgi:hypothetical protein